MQAFMISCKAEEDFGVGKNELSVSWLRGLRWELRKRLPIPCRLDRFDDGRRCLKSFEQSSHGLKWAIVFFCCQAEMFPMICHVRGSHQNNCRLRNEERMLRDADVYGDRFAADERVIAEAWTQGSARLNRVEQLR
jgi:hypothetical protein